MNIFDAVPYGKLLIAGMAIIFFAGIMAVSYKKGVSSDRARSDRVIALMVLEARDRLDAHNREVRALGDELQSNLEKAEHVLQAERDTNALHVAAAAESDGRVRRAISDFARGAGATQDTLATCRDEASRLGIVLGEALRAHAISTGAAEAEAGTARALLAAWPVAGRTPQ
jgi:hypothetical protein